VSGSHEVRIDVSDALPLEGTLEVAASIYPAAQTCRSNRPITLFALPGGTYGRRYFDLHPPGRQGYSFADHLSAAGCNVVALDYVGLGDSTPHQPFEDLTKEVVHDGVDATFARLSDGLEAGTLGAGLEPIDTPFKIGVGHSMGAFFVALHQARHSTFDALALLGWSQLLHWDPASEAAARLRADLAGGIDPTRRHPSLTGHFYDAAVPQDVVEYDTSLATRIFSWVLTPAGSGLLDDPEMARAAEAISVPLFLGFGEADISPNPHAEPAAYPNSPDVTTFVLPQSAHCFNLAGTRTRFFDRIAEWANSIAGVYGTLERKATAPAGDVTRHAANAR
jgi:pimeloyl-ACP methyl ester carboxylesterase